MDVGGKWVGTGGTGAPRGDWPTARKPPKAAEPPGDGDLVLFREPGHPPARARYVVAPGPRVGLLKRVWARILKRK